MKVGNNERLSPDELIVLKSIISGSKCGLFERMLEPEPLGTPGAESYMRCLVSGGSGSLLCVSIDTIARLSGLSGLDWDRLVEVLNHLKYRELVDVESGDASLWEALDCTTWSVRTAGMDLVALHYAQAESKRRSEMFGREQPKKQAKIGRVSLSDWLKKNALHFFWACFFVVLIVFVSFPPQSEPVTADQEPEYEFVPTTKKEPSPIIYTCGHKDCEKGWDRA